MVQSARNDARGIARLLAKTAHHCIADPSASDREIPLNNVYRMLEAFWSTPHLWEEPPVRPSSDTGPTALGFGPPALTHLGEVRAAITRALSAAYPRQPSNQAIGAVISTLRAVIRLDPANPLPQDDSDAALRFFDEMVRCLSVAGTMPDMPSPSRGALSDSPLPTSRQS